MMPLPGRKWQRYIQTKVRVDGQRKTVYLHRYVWEGTFGPIPTGFAIHHLDHDRGNNKLSNLALISIRDHNAHHAPEGARAALRINGRFAGRASLEMADTPAGRRVKGSALAASFDDLPSHMELRDAVTGTPYDEAE